MKVPVWLWITWALFGLVLEMVAVFNNVPNDTLTATLLMLPSLAVWFGLGWVGMHFGTRLLQGRRDRR